MSLVLLYLVIQVNISVQKYSHLNRQWRILQLFCLYLCRAKYKDSICLFNSLTDQTPFAHSIS